MAVNGLYIVQGELNAAVALLRKAHRNYGPTHVQLQLQQAPLLDEEDPLLRNFSDLREVLNSVSDLNDISPSAFLGPFLDVVKSEHTNGPTTGLALGSIGKFLSYGLVDASSITAASAVENIADAVTHARFVGGADAAGDEVVLLKILQVLRTLMLTPVGRLLSNESVCEIMQSGFRICFETRLSELLRKAAEATLADMVQLLFTRLPAFKEDVRHPYIRKLKMRTNAANAGGDVIRRLKPRRKKKGKTKGDDEKQVEDEQTQQQEQEQEPPEAKTETDDQTADDTQPQAAITVSPSLTEAAATADESTAAAAAAAGEPTTPHVVDVHENLGFQSDDGEMMSRSCTEVDLQKQAADVEPVRPQPETSPLLQAAAAVVAEAADQANNNAAAENIRSGERGGVAVVADEQAEDNDKDQQEQAADDDSESRRESINEAAGGSGTAAQHLPYGLLCVREVLRFLVSLTSPLDRQNTEGMMALGLHLLTIALEAGADHLGAYSLLMPLIKNELCRNLMSLLHTDKLPLFAAALRVGFLLMESLRTHLKLQLEAYLCRLKHIIKSDHSRVVFEQKEMALEALDELWRVPGLVTELYLNYDCDIYCSNLFEDIVKLLSTSAFPVNNLASTHILSMDALLTVIDTIDTNCQFTANEICQQGSPTRDDAVQQQQQQLSLPAIDGLDCAKQMLKLPPAPAEQQQIADTADEPPAAAADIASSKPAVLAQFRPNRQTLSAQLPSREQLIDRKKQKRLLTAGTELFNQSPSKGIAFLYEHGLLSSHAPAQVVKWLRDNPGLDKKKIADYICSRKNAAILEAFVKSFPFENVRIDDALRLFLETFRLPGEAAEISMVMTHFAEHWFKSNDEPFVNADAAFTLSYGIIMLNTDQHNPQVKRNQPPMTIDNFKRNLSGCNGGGDFEAETLEEIYHAIKSDEIVMPAEQVGVVRENYLWKVLLRRGMTSEGVFVHAPSGYNDHDLFLLLWGPTIAALSFVFDKSDQDSILQKALTGFRKCARIAAHFGMSDVFDNLIISLCKFSGLVGGGSGDQLSAQNDQHKSSAPDSTRLEPQQAIAVAFGEDHKAQMAARAMFSLIHDHGDILKEGWKNLLDCLLTLYNCELLPASLTEAEDYVDPKGWVSLVRKEAKAPQKTDSGLLSSFVYFLGGAGSETKEPRQPNNDEMQCVKTAHSVVAECHPEQLVTDSKYLTCSALEEFIQAIAVCSVQLTHNTQQESSSVGQLPHATENALVFYLELLVAVALDNKDRLPFIWPIVRRHLHTLLTGYTANPFLVERAVVGSLRLANRNLFRLKEHVSDEVLQSLTVLQRLPGECVNRLACEMCYGLHDLLRTNAANVHRREHWAVLFALLELAGAAAYTPANQRRSEDEEVRSYSDGDERPASAQGLTGGGAAGESRTLHRAYTSDTQLNAGGAGGQHSHSHAGSLAGSQEWIKVDHPRQPATQQQPRQNAFAFNADAIVLRANLQPHDPRAYLKSCESLAFLVRDAAHITPDNFESAVTCVRAFVEASLDGGRYIQAKPKDIGDDSDVKRGTGANKKVVLHREKRGDKKQRAASGKAAAAGSSQDDDEGEGDQQQHEQTIVDSYHQVSLQLLDMCYTLHVKGLSIFQGWANDPAASGAQLWRVCWRPLLQAIARLCCDCRRQVRSQALNYLQGAFAIQDLQQLGPAEWEDCFAQVLFPLLARLADNISPMDPLGMAETRNRAIGLVSKVLLNHLGPLGQCPSFCALWLSVLDFVDTYLHTDRSDDQSEAIPAAEALKNMILILDTTGIFITIPQLYPLTKEFAERLNQFLPDLMDKVLPNPPALDKVSQAPADAAPPTAGVAPAAAHPEQLPAEDYMMEGIVISRPVESPPPPACPLPPGQQQQPQSPAAQPPQQQIFLHPPTPGPTAAAAASEAEGTAQQDFI